MSHGDFHLGWAEDFPGIQLRQLHLCRSKTIPQSKSVLDISINFLVVMLQPGNFGEYEYPFFAIILRSTLAWNGSAC